MTHVQHPSEPRPALLLTTNPGLEHDAAALQIRSIHDVIEPRYAFDLPADDPLGCIRATLHQRGAGDELATAGIFPRL